MTGPRRDHSLSQVVVRSLRSVGMVLVVAAILAPLAAAWGVGHARTDDYLGPHAARYSVNYSGEIALDLGPIGNAYLPSPVRPLGLDIEVGGVVDIGNTDFLSDATLAEYLSVYTDADQVLTGVMDRLWTDALGHAVLAEAVLLVLWLLWHQRGTWLHARVAGGLSAGRMAMAYVVVLALVAGAVLAPPPTPDSPRIPIALVKGTRFDGLTVDNALLYTVLDRGIKGASVLAARQTQAIDSYVEKASTALTEHRAAEVAPGPDESMIFAFSDLHCSIAMTEVWRRLVEVTNPMLVVSGGDDTMNGTAAEQGCITRESAIAGGRPFVVATGNHDSDITEAQMKRAGMQVLDGSVVDVNGINFLGDDDPERNPPFSMERTTDRAETEEELGQRMMNEATGKNVDAIILHQPAATQVITTALNPPTKLVLWGHMHTQLGPLSLPHEDGSWTVALQMGTAGGVRQPTLTSFSTPYSPPLTSADGYFLFRDVATGLITGVQAIHFTPEADVIIDPRIPMGDLNLLPPETRERLGENAQPPLTPPPATPR